MEIALTITKGTTVPKLLTDREIDVLFRIAETELEKIDLPKWRYYVYDIQYTLTDKETAIIFSPTQKMADAMVRRVARKAIEWTVVRVIDKYFEYDID